VSKKKRRFNEDGFDLDLTYITPNIIAVPIKSLTKMGYPAENMEGMYRNKMSEVIRFLEQRHKNHYRVYNLCSERTYDSDKFHGRVACFPFEDHNAPPFELIHLFCQDMDDWLSKSPENVSAVHCKAGKGRTGVMICCYMLHIGMWDSTADALAFYGAARTKNSKGVTIPSQLRYVHYYEVQLRKKFTYFPKTIFLNSFTMNSMPKASPVDGGCSPTLIILMKNVKVFTSRNFENHGSSYKISLDKALPLCGDIKVEIFHKVTLSKDKHLFDFWFNTAFVNGNRLVLRKAELDKANKDKDSKMFESDFKIELSFCNNESL